MAFFPQLGQAFANHLEMAVGHLKEGGTHIGKVADGTMNNLKESGESIAKSLNGTMMNLHERGEDFAWALDGTMNYVKERFASASAHGAHEGASNDAAVTMEIAKSTVEMGEGLEGDSENTENKGEESSSTIRAQIAENAEEEKSESSLPGSAEDTGTGTNRHRTNDAVLKYAQENPVHVAFVASNIVLTSIFGPTWVITIPLRMIGFDAL